MIIQHNLAGLNAKRNQKLNESKLKKNLEKLSSGYRINRAGDDAAGLAISEGMRQIINGSEQAERNIEDGINLIQTTEGAMQEIHAILNRLGECSIASSNNVYNEASREAIEREVEIMKEEIQRIASDTIFFEGMPLLTEDGVGDMRFQIGASEAEKMEVELPDVTLKALGIEDISVVDQDKAEESMDAVKGAVDYLSNERGRMGAYQKRLEHAQQSLMVGTENYTAAESRIRDTDMADEITQYTKNNIIFQAAQSVQVQANAVPQSVLDLLQ